MPSPFPGMNPYLEHPDVWPDFHLRYIAAIAEALGPKLKGAYFARVEQHVYLRELPEDRYRLVARADAAIVRSSKPATVREVAVAAPVIGLIDFAVDEVKVAYLAIYESNDREVIAIIELLSPTNKRPGVDREQFIAKRMRILKGNVHYVELDLLRGFPRMPIENLPACDYAIMVSRWEKRPEVELWPTSVRQPLPNISIPLRSPDEAVVLDLQEVLSRVYDAALYESYLYEQLIRPPLSMADAQWADDLTAHARNPRENDG